MTAAFLIDERSAVAGCLNSTLRGASSMRPIPPG